MPECSQTSRYPRYAVRKIGFRFRISFRSALGNGKYKSVRIRTPLDIAASLVRSASARAAPGFHITFRLAPPRLGPPHPRRAPQCTDAGADAPPLAAQRGGPSERAARRFRKKKNGEGKQAVGQQPRMPLRFSAEARRGKITNAVGQHSTASTCRRRRSRWRACVCPGGGWAPTSALRALNPNPTQPRVWFQDRENIPETQALF